MSEILPSKKIHSIKDARTIAKQRLPKVFFDFVDGASGDEKLCELNSKSLDQIRLEPKVLRNVEKRDLSKNIIELKNRLKNSSKKISIDDAINNILSEIKI